MGQATDLLLSRQAPTKTAVTPPTGNSAVADLLATKKPAFNQSATAAPQGSAVAALLGKVKPQTGNAVQATLNQSKAQPVTPPAGSAKKTGVWGWLSNLFLPKPKKGALVAPLGANMKPEQTQVAQQIVRKPAGQNISDANNPSEFMKNTLPFFIPGLQEIATVRLGLGTIEKAVLQLVPAAKRDQVRADPLFQQGMKTAIGTEQPQSFGEEYNANQQQFGKGLGAAASVGQTIMDVAPFLGFLHAAGVKLPGGKAVTVDEVKTALVDHGVPKSEVDKIKFEQKPTIADAATKPSAKPKIVDSITAPSPKPKIVDSIYAPDGAGAKAGPVSTGKVLNLADSSGVNGIPSNSIEANSLPKPGRDTNVSPSSRETPGSPGLANKSTRYVSPSQRINLGYPSIQQDYSTVSKISQANVKPFGEDLKLATGIEPDVRVKTESSFNGKASRYADKGKSPAEISDVLAGRVVTDTPSVQQQITNIQKNFNVKEAQDFFKRPTAWGYRGVNMRVELPGGSLAEVQIHTPQSLEITGKIHKIYEKWRNLDETTFTDAQRQQYLADQKSSQAIADEVMSRKAEPLTPPATVSVTTGAKASTKVERFAARVKKAADTNPAVAERLNQVYNPKSNAESFAEARKNITQRGYEKSVEQAKSRTVATRISSAEDQMLIKKLQTQGRFSEAIDIVKNLSKNSREGGQATQILAAYSRLTPEGVLRFAQSVVEEYNGILRKKLKGMDVPTDQLAKVPEDVAKKLVGQATRIQAMPDGLPRTIETAKMLRVIQDLVPSSALEKLSLVQTFGQLLNPKTLIRNILGNTGFAPLEQLSNIIRSPLDTVIGKVTGKRTATLFGGQAKAQITGAIEGAKTGYLESRYGINLDNVATKFDLPQVRTFKKGVGSFLETALNWGLRLPDKISYQSAVEQKIAELKSLVSSGKAKYTPDQIGELAHEYGLYRTFQDASPAAEGFSKIKSGLNFGKKFGLGDFVLKYPRTPANLLARALDYSPTGFLKSAFELLRPLAGKIVGKSTPFRQAEFVDSFSRALAGTTGVAGTGAALASVGILTPVTKTTDKDIGALQKEAGLGTYKVNLDGLWRYITSGLNKSSAQLRPGDRLMSYDWLQPEAVMLSIGARMGDPKKQQDGTIANTIVNSLASGIDTIVQQPLVTGIKNLFGASDPVAGVINAAISGPASFLPTFLSQINQLMDNTQRETYSNLWWQEMMYEAAAKVPIWSKTVPPRINVFGQDSQRFQDGSNSAINVLLNPAFMSVYKTNAIGKQVLDLYDRTGEAKQAPSLVAKNQTINGIKVALSASQYHDMGVWVGKMNTKEFLARMSRPDWKNLSDSDKVDELNKINTNVQRAARIRILGDKPKHPSADVQRYSKQEPDPIQLPEIMHQQARDSAVQQLLKQ